MSGYGDLQKLHSIVLTSSWLNAVLYTLEVIVVFHCFWRCSPTRRICALVIGLFLIDTLCVIAVFANAWTALIVPSSGPITVKIPPDGLSTADTTSLDDLPLAPQSWPVSVIVLTTAVVSVFEKMFLVRRFYKLSKNTAITILLVLSVIVHGGFSLFSVVYGAVHSPEDARKLGLTTTLISTVISTTVDTLVPLSIVWLLQKIAPTRTSRDRICSRLAINAVSSGCVAGVIGYVYLTTVITRSIGFIVMVNVIGRIYSLTVLTNIAVGSKTPVVDPETMAQRSSQCNAQIPLQIIPTQWSPAQKCSQCNEQIPLRIIPAQWSPVMEINATAYVERRQSQMHVVATDQDKDQWEETNLGHDSPLSKQSFRSGDKS